MQDPDRVDSARIADIDTASWRTRWRRRRIKRLARGDLILLNALMVIPPGWGVGVKRIGQPAMIVDSDFVTGPRYEWMPGSRIMGRDES